MASQLDESNQAVSNDTFPEVAYFEVPVDPGNTKRLSSRTRELVKHPAFREISSINGEINRLNPKNLKVELEKLHIDTRGTKDVLRKRLKSYERHRVLDAAGLEDPNTPRQHYTHLIVIDFEATCEEHQTKNYIHEIIEFPAVLLSIAEGSVVAEFHSLVQPVLNPELSDFCKQLTGIQQSTVSSAPLFPEVLSAFHAWLGDQGVAPDAPDTKLAVATDGPWDMARFLLMQCSISKMPFPPWARSWINLRKIFSNFYVTKRLCLSEMLSTLGLEFQGRPHCGLDDARNIAAIAEVLIRDGAAPRINETIAHLPRSTPPTVKGSNVASVTLKEFETSERRRNRAANERISGPVAALENAVDELALLGAAEVRVCLVNEVTSQAKLQSKEEEDLNDSEDKLDQMEFAGDGSCSAEQHKEYFQPVMPLTNIPLYPCHYNSLHNHIQPDQSVLNGCSYTTNHDVLEPQTINSDNSGPVIPTTNNQYHNGVTSPHTSKQYHGAYSKCDLHIADNSSYCLEVSSSSNYQQHLSSINEHAADGRKTPYSSQANGLSFNIVSSSGGCESSSGTSNGDNGGRGGTGYRDSNVSYNKRGNTRGRGHSRQQQKGESNSNRTSNNRRNNNRGARSGVIANTGSRSGRRGSSGGNWVGNPNPVVIPVDFSDKTEFPVLGSSRRQAR